jgi:hypothetical protein
MFTQRRDIELLTLFLFAAISILLVFYLRGYKMQNFVFTPIMPVPSVIPTPTPFEPTTTTSESPDGKFTLTMKEQKHASGTTYTFTTSELNTKTDKEIFSTTIEPPKRISIPFNTWSSDDAYIFLKETNATDSAYFVLTADGNPLKPNIQTVNITEAFYKRYTDYQITDITGWAGPTLIVLNTDKKTGGTGPSFWFDVPSQSFIKLSTRFN